MKISDQFCFDLKTSIPVSNSTHYIYLTHNLIKTIWHNCPSSWKMTYQLKILLSSNPLYWWKRDPVKISCQNIKHWTRGTGSSDSEILPQRWPHQPYKKRVRSFGSFDYSNSYSLSNYSVYFGIKVTVTHPTMCVFRISLPDRPIILPSFGFQSRRKMMEDWWFVMSLSMTDV